MESKERTKFANLGFLFIVAFGVFHFLATMAGYWALGWMLGW